jgi:hypothetical protein
VLFWMRPFVFFWRLAREKPDISSLSLYFRVYYIVIAFWDSMAF